MSYPPYPSYPTPGEPGAAPGFPRYGPPQPAGGYPPPPGWVPIAPPEPARGLMIASIVIATLFAGFEVLEAAFAWPAQSEFMEAADLGLNALDVWTPYDFMGILYIPVVIASYVVTCLWLHKVRTNAEAIFPGAHHARARGWVWGSWVCPVVNLWFPFQIVRDVARDPREFTGTALIGSWWTFWLLSLFSGQIGSRLVGFGEINKDAASALGAVETINALFTIVALALWITTVRRIGRMQDELMGIAR